jgi:hypothetical protein
MVYQMEGIVTYVIGCHQVQVSLMGKLSHFIAVFIESLPPI